MFFHIYIAPGQGQTTLCGKILMSTERPCHFAHLLQVSKKYLWSLILYIFLLVFIHVYSPGAGADNPMGSEFLCKHIPHVTLVICCEFLPLNDFLTVFPYKSIRDQIWPCHKIGQGQPKVIIWTNFDGPKAPILHTRPKVTGPLVPEKKIFEAFLQYMGVVAILIMWPRCPEQTFGPLTHGTCTWNLASIGPAVL